MTLDAPAFPLAAPPAPRLDPEVARKIAGVRARVRESFGQVAMSMMTLPRYRHQSIADLQHLLLEPLIRDRVAIAYPDGDDPLADTVGVAIWASVSDEVDAALREQVKAGVFPVRLKPEDWASGPHSWLLDVIAPDRRTTGRVIANFRQVVKEGAVKLHPMVARLVDEEMLKRLRAAAPPAGQAGTGTDGGGSPGAEA